VIVAAALAGDVTDAGLTVQTGVSEVCCGVTWQLRLTVALKLLTVPTVMLEEDVPPGPTAMGENAAVVSVKSAVD
jgi:hypothetical protein